MKLDNSISAVITGGASGLGAATARALAAKGVKVALFDLQKEKGEAVAAIREEMVARALVFDFQRAISRWNQVPGDAIMHLARSAHCFRHFVGVEAERLNFCHQSRLVFENQYWLVRLSDDNSPGLKK